MAFNIFIDTATGTYGDTAGLRIVGMEDYDLEHLEEQSDSGINEYGLVNGQRVVSIGEVVEWINREAGFVLGEAFQKAFDPQSGEG